MLPMYDVLPVTDLPAQLLISHLKECHLFGDAIAVSGPRDWGSTADSLGVSHAYIAQVGKWVILKVHEVEWEL